jgi:hypothetical protein
VDAVEHLPAAVVLAAARSADPRCRPASVKAFWEDLLDALVADTEVEASSAAAAAPVAVAPAAAAAPRAALPGADPAPAHVALLDDAMFGAGEEEAEAFGVAAPPTAPALGAPPSMGAPVARVRRRVLTHALWLAVPLGGAAAAGWPLGGHGATARPAVPAAPAAAPARATTPATTVAPGVAAGGFVTPAAQPAAAAPDPDSAARRSSVGPEATSRGSARRGDRPSAHADSRASAAGPARDAARPAPGADVVLPQIYLLPADGARAARRPSRGPTTSPTGSAPSPPPER